MTGTIEVRFAPNWINGWFMRAFATPFLRVDGVEHPASWGQPTAVPALVGTHRVEAFIRYRRTSFALGARMSAVAVPEGGTVALVAANGPLNSDPFVLSEPASASQGSA